MQSFKLLIKTLVLKQQKLTEVDVLEGVSIPKNHKEKADFGAVIRKTPEDQFVWTYVKQQYHLVVPFLMLLPIL